MAFDDALFQLGMDLTRSSTAQKEDPNEPARVARDTLTSTADESGVQPTGRHLLIDLFGANRLDDLEYVERTLKRCVDVAGATLLHIHLHPLKPTGGVTGVAVLAESHISIHSWPASGYAALDVFMSGDADPQKAVPVLKEAFGASHAVVKTHLRGEDDESDWPNSILSENDGAPSARRDRSKRVRAAA